MKRFFCILFFSFLCAGDFICRAQSDTCIAHLKDANTNIEEGDYDQAIVLLHNSIDHCDFDKEDKISAYKMLIICYSFIKNPEGADIAAMHIIKINPNYTPDKLKDDRRLIKVFQKFKPVPVFAIGFNAGINFTNEKTINSYSVAYPNGNGSYKSKAGLQLGIQAEKRIYRNLWAELGFSYRTSGYSHDLYMVDSSTVQYSEKLTYLDFPLSLKYYFSSRRVSPCLQAGTDFSILSNALSTTASAGQKDIINRREYRNTSQIGYFGGAGINYNIKSFKICFSFRYIFFPEDVNKPGTRYSDQINVFKYNYVDDDFRLDNVQLNICVSYNLFYKNIIRNSFLNNLN